jgi:hypothetical protein
LNKSSDILAIYENALQQENRVILLITHLDKALEVMSYEEIYQQLFGLLNALNDHGSLYSRDFKLSPLQGCIIIY